jgi:tRNA modification GTPase
MTFDTDESIVAIATPPGRGAIATVRVSGPKAFEVARRQIRCRGKKPSARTARRVRFLDFEGRLLDEVVITFFPGPNSYTGEDLVEVSCHGSPVIAQSIVDTFLRAGVRMAEPGEFTLRAVLHGKMDLLQAEAVQDLVESKTDLQAHCAVSQLSGRLSSVLTAVRRDLLDVLCELETRLEFVEERVGLAPAEELLERVQKADRELAGLEDSFQEGRIVHEGALVVLAGKPNVGKSSIFNCLVGADEAIVTDVPGTTRDALKETIDLNGIPVRLVDTAGIRKGDEHSVEQLGVERSLRNLREADLVLFVVDGSSQFGEEDVRIWGEIRKQPYLILINKIDLPKKVRLPGEVSAGSVGRVELSALQSWNLDGVRTGVLKGFYPASRAAKERPTMTRLRHKQCVERARKELRSATSGAPGKQEEEIISFHLRRALDALGELTGEVTTEEILGQIFSSFCIGK